MCEPEYSWSSNSCFRAHSEHRRALGFEVIEVIEVIEENVMFVQVH